MGRDKHVGNEGLQTSCSSQHLRLGNSIIVRPYIGIRNPFSLVEFEPQLGGDLLLKYFEQQHL
jgi:hypothetical protein